LDGPDSGSYFTISGVAQFALTVYFREEGERDRKSHKRQRGRVKSDFRVGKTKKKGERHLLR
jgi:hypothetical protein